LKGLGDTKEDMSARGVPLAGSADPVGVGVGDLAVERLFAADEVGVGAQRKAGSSVSSGSDTAPATRASACRSLWRRALIVAAVLGSAAALGNEAAKPAGVGAA